MLRTMIAAAVIAVIAACAARADGTPEDWKKLAQPIVDEFGSCARHQVDELVKGDGSAEQIADSAMATCDSKLKPLRAVLIAEPFNETQHGVDEALNTIKGEVRAAAIADVKKRRGD